MSQWVRETLEKLTFDEKATLLAGRDRWHTHSIERLGVPSLKVTDGPNGARGEDLHEVVTSTSFPVGAAMGATWNPDLIEDVGRALAHETVAKGAHVLLGPTVNVPRVPNAGRNFECFSEDPLLSGQLAAAWIRGLQSEGIGACIKHFVCNDQETDRHEIDAIVPERSLREIYLEPFRIAVEATRPWSAMSAYNTINGTTASEHPMLDDVLRGEFGFDGLVMSDWHGTYGPGVVTSGLDLEMPGPGRWLSAEAIRDAVRSGAVTEDQIDRKVERLLTLIERTRAWDRAGVPERSDEQPEDRLLARRVAVESMVLLENGGVLPLDSPPRVAVIGEPAVDTPHQGGGSSGVNAHRVVSVLEGIRSAVGHEVEVTWAAGCRVRRWPPAFPAEHIEGGGFSIEHFDRPEPTGEPFRAVTSSRSFFPFFGEVDGVADHESFSIRVSGRVIASQQGIHELSFAAQGRLRVQLDGHVVIDAWSGAPSESVTTKVDLDAGRALDITVEYGSLPGERSRWLGLGWETPGPEPSIEAAAEAAAKADVAVVVAGLGPHWESEGFDRPDLRLPGDQDALIAAVAARQPNTVVVLTVGSPIEMPWLDDVGAVLQAWYGGQEVGHAVADVLFGSTDPGGRLPVTFPADSRQHPGLLNHPGEGGGVHYGEGVYVGYRAFDKLALQPSFPFGHGLSYTTFAVDVTGAVRTETAVRVDVDLTNTGPRSGSEVVQVYGHDIGGVDRRLVWFEKAVLAPGASTALQLEVPLERFRWWDTTAPGGWTIPEGDLLISIRGTFGERMVWANDSRQVPADHPESSDR